MQISILTFIVFCLDNREHYTERFMAMVQKQKNRSVRAKKRFEEFDEELVNSRLKQYAMGDPESMMFALILG
jgi:hypothetical protein